MKLPLTDGSIVTSRLVTLPPISFEVRSTSGVSAVMVTVSASRTDPELHVEGRRATEIEADVTPAVLREARQLRFEGVQTPGGTAVMKYDAVGVADGLANDAGGLIGDGDGDARDCGVLGVHDAPAKLGRALLAECPGVRGRNSKR